MKVIGTLLTTLILVACGGGGSTGETPITGTLSGTAAVGSPIVGASVRVICVGGSTLTSQVTSSLGLWQVSLRGQTFPCAAQVSGGTINGVANTLSLHAIAFDAGTLNITPLTDLVVANATQSAVPGDWFAALNAAGLVSLKEAKLNDTSTLLIDVLGVGYFYDPNHTINPFTTPFAPVSGDTMDDTLTALKGAVSNLGTTYPAFRSDVSVVTGYSPSFDNIATAVHMNFRETVSGRIMFNLSEPIGPNGTGNNTTTGLALNGTPNIDLTKCVASADAFNYEKCQANSIADFGPLKIVNAADGETCTASYVNGVLTVSKGSLSITGYMNGGSMSNILIWGADPVLPVAMIDAYASAGTIMQRPWVSWSDNGALGFIGGFLLNAVGTNTEFTCQSFL